MSILLSLADIALYSFNFFQCCFVCPPITIADRFNFFYVVFFLSSDNRNCRSIQAVALNVHMLAREVYHIVTMC